MQFNKDKSFVMAERLKQLREEKKLSHEKLSKALIEQYSIKISPDSLMNYEVATADHTKAYKNQGMRVEYLRHLADFYGVSTDYLLGLTDVRSVNPDIRAVCEFTGLSEAAISQIRKLQSDSERDFSELLTNPLFIALVDEIWEYSVAVKVDHCAERIQAGYKIPEAIASSLNNTEKHYLGMVLASNESQASYPLMEMLNAQNIGLLSDLADARAKRRLCQLLTEIEGTFVNRCIEESRPDAVSLVHQMKEHSDGND